MLYFTVILHLKYVLEWHARVPKILDLAIPIWFFTTQYSTGCLCPQAPLKLPMHLYIRIFFSKSGQYSTGVAICMHIIIMLLH